jgi:hypothetical protein
MMSAVRNAEGFQGTVGALAHSMKRVLGPALIAAGAAAAAMAVKMGVDGVKAAMENERTASALATTLRNLGKAHEAAGVEEFIAKLESATGIVDDKLRPALGRLVIATEDVDEAQTLLGKSLDAAIGLNKDFGSVVEAVAKAVQTGNAGPLSRYGIVLDQNTVTTKGFTAALDEALDKFKGLQAAEARTLQGQLRILGVEADNLKEAFGRGLLSAFEDSRGGLDSMAESLRELQPLLEDTGRQVGNVAKFFADMGSSDFFGPTLRFFFQIEGPAIKATRAIMDLQNGTSKAADGLHDYRDAAARAGRAVKEVSDNTGDLIVELNNLNAWVNDTTAILDFEDAFEKLSKAIDDNGKKFDTNTPKARDNMRALIDAARKTADLAMAQDTAAEQIDATGKGLDRLKGILDKTQMSPEARAALIAPFQELINDLDNGINDVGRLQAQLNNLQGKSILIEFRTNLNNLPERVRREFYGVATGGLIRGPGGPKADQVGPFMLSNGEFVVQAASVKKFGVDFFESLNRGMNPLGGVKAPGPSRPQPVSTGGSRSLVIQSLNVNAAPGERAESSVPRSLRRLAWVSGLDG